MATMGVHLDGEYVMDRWVAEHLEPTPDVPYPNGWVLGQVTLTLQRIDLDQTPRDLVNPNATGGPQRLDPGTPYELSLAAIQQPNGPFTPGERLRLVLHVDSGPVKPAVARLDVTIVAAPTTPATEAAYALLRRQVRPARGPVRPRIPSGAAPAHPVGRDAITHLRGSVRVSLR